MAAGTASFYTSSPFTTATVAPTFGTAQVSPAVYPAPSSMVEATYMSPVSIPPPQ